MEDNNNFLTIPKHYFRRSSFLFVGFIAFFFFVLPNSISNAQDNNPYSVEQLNIGEESKDFVVGPGKVELEINPGESKTTSLKVTNRMGGRKTFIIEVEDFTGSHNAEQTVVLLGDQRGPYSLKDYLSVPSYEFTLENGERATIPVTLSVPSDEEAGGRYGSVIVSTVSERVEKNDADSAGSAAIISRIGVLFFVKVPGDITESGILRDFRTITGRNLFFADNVKFEILFENTGNVHLNPYGEIKIKNWLGKEVDYLEIDPWFALPNSLRFREVSWERSWLIGMYKAEISINRGYENIIDTDNFVFFVLPWKVTSMSVLVVMVFIILIKFIFSRFEIKRKS